MAIQGSIAPSQIGYRGAEHQDYSIYLNAYFKRDSYGIGEANELLLYQGCCKSVTASVPPSRTHNTGVTPGLRTLLHSPSSTCISPKPSPERSGGSQVLPLFNSLLFLQRFFHTSLAPLSLWKLLHYAVWVKLPFLAACRVT